MVEITLTQTVRPVTGENTRLLRVIEYGANAW